MAVDAYIYFTAPSGFSAPEGETADSYFSTKKAFELKEFSFDVEHAHTIGSATKGAGSGKVKFNEFSIKKPTDKASCNFFMDCVLGAHYENVVIAVRKAGAATDVSGKPYLEYCFNTVFVTKVEWSGPGDEGPEESITFAYGKLGVRYRPQKSDGTMDVAKLQGWDQQLNKSWTPADTDFSGADAASS